MKPQFTYMRIADHTSAHKMRYFWRIVMHMEFIKTFVRIWMNVWMNEMNKKKEKKRREKLNGNIL